MCERHHPAVAGNPVNVDIREGEENRDRRTRIGGFDADDSAIRGRDDETGSGWNMPLGIPREINQEEDFDLIILAYQIWYLSPSVPISTFLQSKQAERIMKGKPVVTLVGARNMWLMAQEKVKKRLNDIGAKLVANIALVDRNKNLISAVTIVYWMMTGKKKSFLNIFPK